MKRIIIFISKACELTLFIVITFIIIIPPVKAVDSTQSATQSADFKSKLKALQEGIASRAANLKVEIGKKLQNRAYIGLVESKDGNLLTLNVNQSKKQVYVNEYTEYSGKVSFKSLGKDDYITALGDVDDKEALTAKKIIKFSSTSSEQKQIFYGQVISVDEDNINIKTKEATQAAITTGSNTTYQLGKEPASSVSVNIGKTIIAITTPSKDNTFKARFIYILSQGISIKPKIATTSAQATSSAKKLNSN